MLILAIDTSGKTASCALLRDGALLDATEQDSVLDHSRLLLPLCQSLLERNGLTLDSVDLFASVIGPGSFTGVRIGTAAVKGFAWAQSKPCAGISSLLTMAEDAEQDGIYCCSLRARAGESFFAVFEKKDGTVTRLTEDAVASDEQMAETAAKHKAGYFLRDCQRASGAAKAAWVLAQRGEIQTCHDIMPAYLRITQAERMRKERLEQQ